MIKVISQKVDRVFTSLPPAGLIAELLLEETNGDKKEQFYLTIVYDDMDHFSISKQSVYDFYSSDDEDAEPAELIEEYEEFEKTKNSKYYEYFIMADKLVDEYIEKNNLK